MNTHRCVLLQGVQDIKNAYAHLGVVSENGK